MEQQDVEGRKVTRARGAVAPLDLLVHKERLDQMDLKVTFGSETGTAGLLLEFIRKTSTDLLRT